MKRYYSGTPRETIPMRLTDFFIDAYAKWFYKKRKRAPISNAPKVLVASLGHMGDALTVSYMFPLIRQKYPNAIIDVLTPTWCKVVSEHNPYVRQIICIDHFLSNRAKVSDWQKIKQFYATFKKAIAVLKNEEYDYYIDVRTSNAVSHFVLPFTQVKKAIGFNRRGQGGLLDVELTLPENTCFHHFDTYAALLKEMGIEAVLEEVKPYFPILPTISWETIGAKLPSPLTKPYVMLFPETGEPHRQMSLSFWADIVKRLLKESPFSVVYCGQTDLSSNIIDEIKRTIGEAKRLINASRVLSIHELVYVANEATYALTLDSFPEHLTCIFCKTITVYRVSGLPFFPIANFPTLLFHGHRPSVGIEYVRKNVEIYYYSETDIPEVKNKIAERILLEKVMV
jgi:heptosyltransferase-3